MWNTIHVDSLLTKPISSLCQNAILGVNFPVQPAPSCIPMHREIPVHGNIARSHLVLHQLMKAENQYMQPDLLLVGTPIWYILDPAISPGAISLLPSNHVIGWDTKKWHHILLSTLTSVANDLLNVTLQLDNELSAWATTCSWRWVRELQTNNMGSKIPLYRIHGMYLKFRLTNSAEFATWYV